jgi:EAL domain-containing protein (putative c-di-GMP-specific phosphodiesterase class I)
MTSIGEWVIGRACRQLKVWQRSLPAGRVPPLHVNISPTELWHTDFVARFERQVIDLDLDPTSLRLEVPEAALAANRSGSRDLLARLTGIGVELWLDGFGRGGMPLADLPALPLSHLKIDRSVAWSDGLEQHRPAPLLHGLVGLAHDLGWQITAGGVETPDQRDILRKERCDLGQGFFFSAPVDAEGVLALL